MKFMSSISKHHTASLSIIGSENKTPKTLPAFYDTYVTPHHYFFDAASFFFPIGSNSASKVIIPFGHGQPFMLTIVP